MDIIYEQLLERNLRETTPFVSIYDSYVSLLNFNDSIQDKCSVAEREVESLRQQLHDIGSTTGSVKGTPSTSFISNSAIQSAMRNETRLREKLEGLQEEYNEKVIVEMKKSDLLEDAQTLNSKNEKIIADLTEQLQREKNTTERLGQRANDAEANSNLMDEQNFKLKIAFRTLQDENDKLKNENSIFEGRLVAEKEKVVDEMNELTDMIERLKAEIERLRSHAKQQESTDSKATPSSWFGGGGTSAKRVSENKSITGVESSARSLGDAIKGANVVDESTVPTTMKQTVPAHLVDGTCVRYDHSGTRNNVATASSDSTVKVWDTISGQKRGMFRCSPGYSMICCDVSGTLVVGGGNDRSCRVWDLRNERMIHQLVGHQNKINCVRIFGGDKPSVVTGSADRTLKVWDISRMTYRLGTTLNHNSTATCIDVSSDFTTLVTGHMDGGLRFWDLRCGQLTADMSVLHEGGISSVQFKPNDDRQVLSSSVDSSLKVVDVRSGKAVHTFNHSEHVTGQNWSGSVFSPNGRYVASGSSSDGTILVWDTLDRSLSAKLSNGHTAGIISIDWCPGASGGQQLASLDRKGNLVLWA